MHHIAGFVSSIADVTLAEVTPLPDQILRIQNNHFVSNDNRRLLFAALQCASGLRARIVTPALRVITTPWIRPIGLALVPAAEPRVADYRESPLLLRGLEEIAFEAFQSSGGAAEAAGIIGLDWGQTGLPPGELITMRGTSVTAAVADSWTQLAVTWQDALPAGQYAIVGLEVQSTNARAARLILENTTPRPGSIGVAAIGSRQHAMFQKGGLGVWGYFSNTIMPIVEVWANAADNAHEIYLDIVKVR